MCHRFFADAVGDAVGEAAGEGRTPMPPVKPPVKAGEFLSAKSPPEVNRNLRFFRVIRFKSQDPLKRIACVWDAREVHLVKFPGFYLHNLIGQPVGEIELNRFDLERFFQPSLDLDGSLRSPVLFPWRKTILLES